MNNNLFKLNLNSNQLIKFGLHIGQDSLDYTNSSFILGIRNNIKYINVSESLLQLKRLSCIYKKILSKKEVTLVNHDNKSKILKKLSANINSVSLYNFKVIKNFKSGFVSNREIRKKFLYLKKYSDSGYISNRNFFKIANNSRVVLKNFNIKNNINYSNEKFPSLLILLGLNKNLLLEFKNKNILTSCLVDTSNFHYASDYNILLNNKSISSISYFTKILRK